MKQNIKIIFCMSFLPLVLVSIFGCLFYLIEDKNISITLSILTLLICLLIYIYISPQINAINPYKIYRILFKCKIIKHDGFSYLSYYEKQNIHIIFFGFFKVELGEVYYSNNMDFPIDDIRAIINCHIHKNKEKDENYQNFMAWDGFVNEADKRSNTIKKIIKK